MRRSLVLGNWKQNTTKSTALELLTDLSKELNDNPTKTELGVIPPALVVQMAVEQCQNSAFEVGVQNVSSTNAGAFTGEVGADMVASMGAKYALVGHSERREYFKESADDLANKIVRCLEHDLLPVYCIGEQLEVRQSGDYLAFIKNQLEEVFSQLQPEQITNLVIAYEPVWAIGTGETASAEQAQEVHAMIRQLVHAKIGTDNITILYGGSCKPSNAKELFSQPDIDGGLIGGASLNAKDFVAIANSF